MIRQILQSLMGKRIDCETFLLRALGAAGEFGKQGRGKEDTFNVLTHLLPALAGLRMAHTL